MVPPELAKVRWTVHPATAENDEELLSLFHQVFGHVMPLSQWQWKYANAPVRGMLLRRGDATVAFFGGMPRAVKGPLRTWTAVQNGDVMVLPSERGVFSRHGALHHVAAAFFDQLVGPSLGYEFAFGFPSERHFKLGTKLGLYAAAGRMYSLSWTAQPPAMQPWTKVAPVTAQAMRAVDSLWRDMGKAWPQHFIPERSAAHWTARFLSHPTQRYDVLIVRRRWTGRPLCALVLREHPGHLDWLDYVGPRAGIALAVATARRLAGERGGKAVMALLSEDVAASFAAHAASCVPSDIHIPVNARPQGEDRPYLGRLWLMGGDTDFL